MKNEGNMENKNLKFVIVGHVDHGKSTLIGRLLYDTNSLAPDKIEEIKKFSDDLGRGTTEFAFLLDHLQEERDQGITIDTAQTFFKTDKREYVIIDAPGHVEFVKNMITGASQAEAAILIVDAKEGVQEQTKRHAYILSLLGLNQIVVVLNKMDLLEYKEEAFEKVKEDTEKFLKSINVSADCYVPIAALLGENIAKKSEKMEWYNGHTVLESLDFLKTKSISKEKSLIFAIQDVYKIDDKRIIAGRVETGEIKAGQKIKVLPSGQETEVISVEKFNEKPEKAGPGENIGIITKDPLFIEKGNIACDATSNHNSTDTFEANVFWMSKEEIKKNEPIILKCATQEVYAKIQEIKKRVNSSSLEVIEEDAEKLGNLEVGEVIIKTDKPIVVDRFNNTQELGRFVLERNENTVAGGIII